MRRGARIAQQRRAVLAEDNTAPQAQDTERRAAQFLGYMDADKVRALQAAADQEGAFVTTHITGYRAAKSDVPLFLSAQGAQQALTGEQIDTIMDLAGNFARSRGKVEASQHHDALDAYLRSIGSQHGAQEVQQPLPTMRAAFRTTTLHGGAKPRFTMEFNFPSLDAMNEAGEEWLAFVEDCQAGATGEQSK
jgi:hypothetical protein